MGNVVRGALADHASLLIRCSMFAMMLTLVAVLDVDATVIFVLAAAAFGSELLPKTLISLPERERPAPMPGDPALASMEPVPICPPDPDAEDIGEVEIKSAAKRVEKRPPTGSSR